MIFHLWEWIGVGKKYTLDVPQAVANAKNDQLRIPEAFQKNIPSADLSVNDFLQLNLPTLSNEFISTKPHIWFNNEKPNTNPLCLMSRPIPTKFFLDRLHDAFGQAWLNGANSISDPQFNDSKDRLPLWCLSFWKEMMTITKHCKKWASSQAWLEREKTKRIHGKDTVDLIEKALTVIQAGLKQNLPLSFLCGNTSTIDLTTLLANEWLSDTHINMMMETLSKEVSQDPTLAKSVMITPLAFANEIMNNGRNEIYLKKHGAAVLC